MALAEPSSGHREQTIEAVHRDVEFALRFRLELIKHLLALAAAVLAFTATFRPTLASPVASWLMGIGWLALAASVAGGLVHMRGWDRFYMTYRDYDWKLRVHADPEERRKIGKAHRKKINAWRDAAMWIQYLGFVVGIVAIGLFAWLNLDTPQLSVQQLPPQ